MTKEKFKQLLPSQRDLHKKPVLRFVFGTRLFDPQLWYLNKNSIALALGCGFFIGYLPIPMQMLIVALLALLFRFNLPAGIAMVWISNPLTWVALYYPGYRLGAHLINYQEPLPGSLNAEWFLSHYPPLFIGCAIIGICGGVLCFLLTRLVWRLHIIRRWQARRKLRITQKKG